MTRVASLAVLAALMATPAFAEIRMSDTVQEPQARLPTPVAAPVQVTEEDPYIWLEEVEGERALAWVADQNARSLGRLQGDPLYDQLHAEALALVESRDRIPSPAFRRVEGVEGIDNFWQDANSVRGVWRTTTPESYATPEPAWETVLDLDALARAEDANWVWRGASCLEPAGRLCLVELSDGGKDASTLREFDRVSRTFVEGGFVLPESKGSATWIDADTLIVARDFGEGSLTESGYPRVLKRLARGQALDQAQELFRGEVDDVFVNAFTLRDPDGRLRATLISRAMTFYTREYHLVQADGSTRKLDLPEKASITGLLGDRLILTTDEDFTAGSGQSFQTGDLFSVDLDAWLADPATPMQLILRPGPREAIEGVQITRNRLVVALYENVRGGVYVYQPTADGWSRQRMDLPQNVSVGLGSASDADDRVFVSVNGYLTPSTLYLADAGTLQAEAVKSLPAKFDATGLEVRQFEARSADGTMIPYFVVGRSDLPTDGSAPTLLYGYGGFQVSMLPGYSPTVGKLWLERGGVYVVANTRGGGEFGPRWHQAALQENRQRAHEDFQAVALDLIARGITSQPHLGIMGGSQGGLFMGAMLTQRPDLINAAVIQVPLFDMLRYHRLLAGASWIAEYGNPDIPEQRAWIEAYSPYQNLRAGQPYPEVFIHTSTKDDRVHPGHARKAAARLEELGYPVLFYENTDGGHAAGANLRETARRLALEYTYLSRRLMAAE